MEDKKSWSKMMPIEELVEKQVSEKGEPIEMSKLCKSFATIPERVFLISGLVKSLVMVNIFSAEKRVYTKDNLPPVPSGMPIMTTVEAATMKFGRHPETPEECARFLAYRLERPIVVGSIGCGKATIERNLLALGIVKQVIGVEIDPHIAQTTYEQDSALHRTNVATHNKTPDELREEVCAAVDGSDLIIFGDSLHHTDNPYLYFSRCFDGLLPGRYIYVSEPFDIPGDKRTRNELFPLDSTDFPDSMLSLDEHQRWINWALLRGGEIVHSEAVPGYIAGDSDAYGRTKPILSLRDAESHGEKLMQLAGGTLTQLDDPYNRIRVVVEKGFEHDPPYCVPQRFAIEENGTLDELGKSFYDVFPFCVFADKSKQIIEEKFKEIGMENATRFLAGFFDASQIRKEFILEPLQKYLFNPWSQ